MTADRADFDAAVEEVSRAIFDNAPTWAELLSGQEAQVCGVPDAALTAGRLLARARADLRAAREEVQQWVDKFDERLNVALDDFDLPGLMAERDGLQRRVDAALVVLDVQWRWCYGRKRINPNLVRVALGGGSSD